MFFFSDLNRINIYKSLPWIYGEDDLSMDRWGRGFVTPTFGTVCVKAMSGTNHGWLLTWRNFWLKMFERKTGPGLDWRYGTNIYIDIYRLGCSNHLSIRYRYQGLGWFRYNQKGNGLILVFRTSWVREDPKIYIYIYTYMYIDIVLLAYFQSFGSQQQAALLDLRTCLDRSVVVARQTQRSTAWGALWSNFESPGGSESPPFCWSHIGRLGISVWFTGCKKRSKEGFFGIPTTPPRKLTMTMENPPIWRCISYWNMGIFQCHG